MFGAHLCIVTDLSESPQDHAIGSILQILSVREDSVSQRVFSSFLSLVCQSLSLNSPVYSPSQGPHNQKELKGWLLRDYVDVDMLALKGLQAIESTRYGAISEEMTVGRIVD